MIPLIIQSIESSDDREFMRDVYISYKRLMFSEIVKIVRDYWAADDILQNVIIKLIGKLQLLRTLDTPKLTNYIIVTSRNAAKNHLRSMNKTTEVSYDDEFENDKLYAPEIDERLLFRELHKNVGIAWEKLDERHKQVLELKYLLKKTNVEISKDLGIQPDSVRMLLTRARNSLKAYMENDGAL